MLPCHATATTSTGPTPTTPLTRIPTCNSSSFSTNGYSLPFLTRPINVYEQRRLELLHNLLLPFTTPFVQTHTHANLQLFIKRQTTYLSVCWVLAQQSSYTIA